MRAERTCSHLVPQHFATPNRKHLDGHCDNCVTSAPQHDLSRMSLPNFDLYREAGRSEREEAAPDVARSIQDDPGPKRRRRPRQRQRVSNWQTRLGIHPETKHTQLAALLLHFTTSVLFLVFLNSEQPFFISQLGRAGYEDHRDAEMRLGLLMGRLAFSDELLSIFMLLFWGATCDRIGLRTTTAVGYCLIAMGLLSYAVASNPWPDLLWCRLTFAAGASAVTAMLTASLAAFSAPSLVNHAESTQLDETTPLLEGEAGDASSELPQRHGRLSSLAGLCTGFGAVIAVFMLLPLPTRLAQTSSSTHNVIRTASADRVPSDDTLEKQLLKGTRLAFILVASFALLVAILMALGLDDPWVRQQHKERSRRRREEQQAQRVADRERAASRPLPGVSDSPRGAATIMSRQARRQRLHARIASSDSFGIAATIRTHAARVLSGFHLASSDSSKTLWLAYVAGSLARCVTVASTLFLPLFIAHHFYIVDPTLCPPPASNHLPPSKLRKTCKRAYTLTAAQGGLLQTVALVASPLVGLAADRKGSGQKGPFAGPIVVIIAGALCGMVGFGIYAFALPTTGVSSSREVDPTATQAWIAAALLGICQIASIVGSLTLVARCRDHLMHTRRQGRTANLRRNRQTDDEGVETGNDTSTQSARHRGQPESNYEIVAGAGAIAGAYSSLGALSILLLGSVGGWLFDLRPQGPFEILTGASGLVTVIAVVVWFKQGDVSSWITNTW